MPDIDVWGIKEIHQENTNSVRQLERVQPLVTYSKALNAEYNIQREIYSVFEFARSEIQCLNRKDILAFMGGKLTNLIPFDAAVFYMADLGEGTVKADYVLGPSSDGLTGLTLGLEQKLSGWVAANRQALCNLPPFPDFLACPEPRPAFQVCAIAPMHRGGTVYGAISLYRTEKRKFSEEEFRRLEIITSQTAIALSKRGVEEASPVLFDALTGVPNGFQLYLVFDQIAMDAQRYDYPVAVLSIHVEDLRTIRRRWGHMSGDEAVRTIAKQLGTELRETDLLVRYASDEFVALSPRMNRDQAEALKSRLQNTLDHSRFAVRPHSHIPLPTSVGISIYPDDGTDLESLLLAAEWRMLEDRELRTAVNRRIRPSSPPS
jgi:diguanylate cyclase (GGDEF)-like protein